MLYSKYILFFLKFKKKNQVLLSIKSNYYKYLYTSNQMLQIMCLFYKVF